MVTHKLDMMVFDGRLCDETRLSSWRLMELNHGAIDRHSILGSNDD